MFKRIFITGGTGYIGKSILDYRARNSDFLRDTELVFLSRDPEKFKSTNSEFAQQHGVTLVKGDVRDFEFPKGDFDAVINAASPVLGAASDKETVEINERGTVRVLAFMRHCHARRLLLTSSGAVYGGKAAPLTERDDTAPATAYGRAKIMAEKLCVDSDVSVGIARIFAQVGKFLPRNGGFAIGNFIRDALAGRDIVINSNGSPMRSYMYADDLVEWLFAILKHGESGRPYNVGSSEAISIRDLAALVRETLGSKSEIKVLGNSVAGVADYYVPDVERAKRELGLVCKTSLHDAILRSA